jgi:hypothetical protein
MDALRRYPIALLSLSAVPTAVLILATAAPAAAAEPANRACLGRDVSTYARAEGPHGDLISSLARAGSGLGALVQMHQAGLLPDTVVPNTCND